MTVRKVRLDLGARSYDVLIGAGLIDAAGERLSNLFPGRRTAIVTDDTVARVHLPALRSSLERAGMPAAEIIVPPGEGSKSFSRLEGVVDALLEAKLERADFVTALGGGVIGDLAGFAAAVTRRGMRFVQLPTTLLAQVDSSVGGKTGINSRFGKNLVGAFHQPALVLADTDALSTLPPREFAAGYAEVVKYGLINDRGFFDWLAANREEVFRGGAARVEAVAASVRAKAKIVAADEHETGERALLNLGHTFGHALEAACRYDPARLVHGEAVAIGMVLAHRFSAELGLAPAADAELVRAHLKEAGLPVSMRDIPGEPISAAELLGHIGQDKKVKRGRLTFILTRGIGQAFIADDVSAERVLAFLAAEAAPETAGRRRASAT